MQLGAYEAVLGRPVLRSAFKLSCQRFNRSIVHVDNTVETLVAGIRSMREDLVAFRAEVEELRRERLQDWNRVGHDPRQVAAG